MRFPPAPPSSPGFAASCDASAAMSEGVRPACSICSPRPRRTSLMNSADAWNGLGEARLGALERPLGKVDDLAVPVGRDDEEAAADDLGRPAARPRPVRLELAALRIGGADQRHGDAPVLRQGLGFGILEADGGRRAGHVGKDCRLPRQVAHGHVDRRDLGAGGASADLREAPRDIRVGAVDLEVASGGVCPHGLREVVLDIEHGIGRAERARRGMSWSRMPRPRWSASSVFM